MLILAIIGFGMLMGWLAQLIMGQGARPNGMSLVAGLLGSFIGGMIASLIAGDGLALRPSGVIGTLIGAMIFLLIVSAINKPRAARR